MTDNNNNNTNTFDEIHLTWKNHIEKFMLPIINNTRESLEGNIYSYNNTTHYDSKFYQKQYNIYISSIQENVTNAMEIGFNSGFSALLILLSNPKIKLTCVDINSHHYVLPCFKYLKNIFQDRIELITGNSMDVVSNLTDTYDLIHIDGCHDVNVARIDIINSRLLANDKCIMIMDDTDYEPLNQLWIEHVEKYNLLPCDFIETKSPYHTIHLYKKPTLIAFYVCFFGNDTNCAARVPKLPSNLYDCYYFTNNKNMYDSLKNSGWKRIFIKDVEIKNDNTADAFDSKELKSCPNHYEVLNNYTFSCYFDSKTFTVDVNRVLYFTEELIRTGKHFAIPLHPFLKENVYNELNESMKMPQYVCERDKYEKYIQRQLSLGLHEKMPNHYATQFIVRKSGEVVNKLNDTWYEHIKECGIECQISFFFIQQLFSDIIYTINFCDGYSRQ